MADDKRGRDEQAHNEEERQRKRDLATALERGDEPEPPIPAAELGELEDAIGTLSYPVTGSELVTKVGDREVAATAGPSRLDALLPETDAETFDSPAAVSAWVRKPPVAVAMKRVVEAAADHQGVEFGGSQRDAYRKTLEALAAIDDDGVDTVTDWIVERTREKGALPGSRAVRRQAASVSRANGHEISADEWLGI